ncbi:fibrocystin-L-like [Antedon mediterranea]|uniref:fibrocystin-L-like n=1 Tax=Antedon mediterranea TaxID=105859 RepID=UPI003AF879C8
MEKYRNSENYIKSTFRGTSSEIDEVDSKNITFLVSSGYGRSYTESGAYSVSFKGELYLFQLHADIKGVTPNYGSYRGGTHITIVGKYFGTKIENVAVDVGGVKCELVSVKDNAIECVTGEQPSNQTTVPGNRGIYREVWKNKVNSDFSDARSWNTLDSDYYIEVRDEFQSPDNPTFGETDYYSSRYRGFFVAPYDGIFKFMIYSDDESQLYFSMTENPEDKMKIAFNSRATKSFYTRPKEQISNPLKLTGGTHYYIEAYHHQHRGSHYVNVGLMLYDLPISNADYSGAVNEKQTISITSSNKNQLQYVRVCEDLDGTFNNASMDEITDNTLLIPNCSNEYVRVCEYLEGTFNITFMDETTGSLSANATANEVQDAINNLQSVAYPVSVNKTIQWTGNVFVIHFPPSSGNVEQVVGSSDDFQVNSSTAVEGGMDTIDSFSVILDSVESTALSSSSTAEDFEEALIEMFSIKCKRSGLTGMYINDYEGTANEYESGIRVLDMEPYCGRASLKNPSAVYKSGKTKSSNGETVDVIDAKINGKVCLDYRGALSQDVMFTIHWKHYEDGDQRSDTIYTISELYETNRWRYTCFDIYNYILQDDDLIYDSSPRSPFDVEVITLYQDGGDFYIDNLNIGSSTITYIPTRSAARPNNMFVTDISVVKYYNNFNITLTANCAYGFPLLQVKAATITNGSVEGESDYVVYSNSYWRKGTTISIHRLIAASKPISGSFMMEWNGKNFAVHATYSAKQMKDLLEGYFATGVVAVEKTSTCSSAIWTIEWTDIGGNHEPIEVNGTSLVGDDVSITVTTDADGALLLAPIPGDYLRTPHSSPQVEVYINEVISSCATDNCTFDYNEDYTAEITNIDIHSGSEAEQTSITINGTGFSVDCFENIVTIGDIACEVQSCIETQIVCDVQNGKAGIYEVRVVVVPYGYSEGSSTDVTFNYTININRIEPVSGSESGGTEVTIYGQGFSNIPEENNIAFGSTRCVATQSSFNIIHCTLEVQNESRQKRSLNSLNVSIEVDKLSSSIDNAFTQNPALTPTVSSISPTSSSVLGGGTIVILSTIFGTKKPMVYINELECTVISFSDTEIQCTVPGNEPGIYDVMVSVPGKGYAHVGSQAQFSYDLEINGIYPDHGSLQGGTTVSIIGSGFGTNTSLVDVLFGRVTCDITHLNDDLIKCTSRSSGVVHTVTNQGKHEYYGVGYKWDPQVLKIMAGDTVMWQWSTPALVDSVGYTVQQTADSDSVVYDGEGFYAGSRSKSGTYSHTFYNEGDYYYSSDPVNYDVPEEDKFYLTGIIQVAPFGSVAYPVSVKLNGIAAKHDVSAQSNTPTDSSSFPGDDDSISGCYSAMPDISYTSLFSFAFWDCSTATIDVIEPVIGSAEQTITIRGSGFSNVSCENVVMIGNDHVCSVTFSNKTLIECTIATNNTLLVGYYHEISVNVKNQGYAINVIDTLAARSYILVPSITSVDPSEGSLAGGTVLTIEGNGFAASSVDELIVSLGPESCLIQSFNYTHIICATTSHDVSGHVFDVAIELNQQSSINIGGQPFSFIYQQHLTMQVQDLFQDTISGALTTIYVNGSDFGDVISDITVTFGNVDCAVVAVNSEEIECEVGYVPVGELAIMVHRKRYGNANLVNFDAVWGDAVINTIIPQQGSTKGGTMVTIEGSGFHTDDTSVVIDGDVC